MKRIVLSFLLVSTLAVAQPKKIVEIPVQSMVHGAYGLSIRNALRLYALTFTSQIVDTTIMLYVKQSVYWTAKMWHPYNYVINGNFDSTGQWLFLDSGGGGNFWVDDSNHYASVVFNNASDNMQLYQTGTMRFFNKMRYRLSFGAWSKHGSRIGVYVHKHESPFVPYLAEVIDLQASPLFNRVSYTFEFTTPDSGVSSQDKQRIRFWFPSAILGDTISITDVRIQELVTFPEQKISFDSVMGRGANRLAQIAFTFKTADTSGWYREGWDTAGVKIKTPTRDSTSQSWSWLNYTYDVDPAAKYFKQFDACSGKIWHHDWNAGGVDMKTEIRLTKILGDPTVNQGRDQRALIRIRAYEDVNGRFMDWLETQSSSVIDYWNWPTRK